MLLTSPGLFGIFYYIFATLLNVILCLKEITRGNSNSWTIKLFIKIKTDGRNPKLNDKYKQLARLISANKS